MNDRILSLLGLMRRAGRLTLGFDAVCDSVKKGDSSLVVTAKDISDGSLRKLRNNLDGLGTEIVGIPYAMEDIGAALSKKVRIISINDSGFAERLMQLLQTGNGEE
ncbi:MAG: ribosomal L7Ae/L30e/S12e/Gadd45 family protein [Clostridia bacterium]|nr:ribosomal L7Ae/L30e/S12e/Gadd45 family protein [Clostridia bacterium]MBQ9993146.1 ribosomal L7Ae/L30e/S12e/Gadd45 family protein [Clostridia bacterium]